MKARVTIESAGSGATIQDAGRFGFLRYGVTPAGPMDWVAFQTANRALGNATDAAAIEIAIGGLALTTDTPLVVAYAGAAFIWTSGGRPLPAAARLLLRPGESLRARAGPSGSYAYLAVPGGIDVDPVLGSRSTHTRSRLGGLEGRQLQSGDVLSVAKACGLDDAAIDTPSPLTKDAPIRVVLGPQNDLFRDDAIATFFAATYSLTAQADRMAYKLDGPRLAHRGDFNIVSDGVALGAIQVAGDGQPLVLMADRQPTGGYPKIGHVCRADIGRFAQGRPGETCRFARITPQHARAALFETEALIGTIDHCLVPLRLTPTDGSLFVENLISGVRG